MTSHIARWGVAVLSGAVVGLVAAPAYAHVEVGTGSVPAKGGVGVVALTVPTESDTASTIGLTVTIPDDVTLAAARVLPVPGWSARVQTEAGRVVKIVWRADNAGRSGTGRPGTGKSGTGTSGLGTAGIGPSEFGVFTFWAGPWPQDRDSVPLPTAQQYSDGTTVAWDEVAVDADSEPEHPAPIVTLGAAASAHHHDRAASATETRNVASTSTGDGDGDGRDSDGGAEIAQWVLIGLAVLLSASAAARTSIAAARGR